MVLIMGSEKPSMLKVELILLFLCASILSSAQVSKPQCSCCSDDHLQFDFWVGSWSVSDTLGNPIGKNRVEKIQSGCVLMENWTSANMTGTSYNYFDAADSTWNQLWLDSNGGQLKLKGGLINDEMVLKSELIQGKKSLYYNQLSWKENDDKSVTQTWKVFDKNDQLLQLIFLGIYKRE